MNYSDSIEYLYGLVHNGIKLGIRNPERLLALLGNPQRTFKSVHIAGTNGKGSTASMVASILKEAGAVTGLFTSPHLLHFTERIQVNGEHIGEADIVRLTGCIRIRIQDTHDLQPTFFEFITAMAFLYFREQGVQWAVVETGMGGRYDATNVLKPHVTVITPVDMDHKEFLGDTLSSIAHEKAGIIKEGVPLVLAPQKEDALSALKTVAKEKHAPLLLGGEDFRTDIREVTQGGVRFDYSDGRSCENPSVSGSIETSASSDLTGRIENLLIPLIGSHQAVNGSVAIKTVKLLAPLHFSHRDVPKVIRSGLQKTGLPGRCEFLSFHELPILLDGAHNPEAARTLSNTLSDVFLSSDFTGIILIFGAMSDKDVQEMLKPYLPLTKKAIFTAPSYSRAMNPEAILTIANGLFRESEMACRPELHSIPSLGNAIDFAERIYERGDLIVITGSFYTIGEAKGVMGEKAVLGNLREVM
jgi:dihydrofolate synthase/folylpolyglutamate synthase